MHNPINIESVKQELQRALEARQVGKEGRARVCARRAAGWAVLIYRRQTDSEITDENAMKNLEWLKANHSDEVIRSTAGRLIVRVGEDYRLPHTQDPLEDAGLIIARLLE